MPKAKFYAVAVGRKVGVFKSWDACKAETSGFPNACYKSFKTETEALEYISSHVSSSIAKKRASSEVQGTSAANKRCQKFDTTLNIGIMFDGGSRGNPGLAGAGAVVTITKIETEEDGVKRSSHKAIYYIRKYLGAMLTNNIAEYEGLLIGLRKACEEAKKYRTTPLSLIHTNLVVQGDSKLIINQLNGEFQCKNILLKPKHREAVELLEALERLGACKKALEHIYRKDNNVADRLANEAMDQQRSWYTTSMDGQTPEVFFE